MTAEITPATQLPTPARIGQGTAVEQSRAVAEVQAAIVVAQQCPRDVQSAVTQMRESCKQMALAERAFYRYPRAGGTVTGPSVHLARELARCWGNVQYGLVEMRRDDEYGQSEMQSFAWDVQTNSRTSSTFVVPHKRDTRDGPKTLTDMRDVYENNANNGARRVREAIFAILPPWFVEEAKDLCSKTLQSGGGLPLPQRIANAVEKYTSLGVTVDQLEQKVGRPRAQWTDHDAAQLGVIYTSLQRGEVTRDEEFPPRRVTLEEVTGPAPAAASPAHAATDQPAQQPPLPDAGDPGQADTAAASVTNEQLGRLAALFNQIGWTDRKDMIRACAVLVGRSLAASADMTHAEATSLITTLDEVAAQDDPADKLTDLVTQKRTSSDNDEGGAA